LNRDFETSAVFTVFIAGRSSPSLQHGRDKDTFANDGQLGWLTNPGNSDSDSGGHGDRNEIAAGTKPNDLRCLFGVLSADFIGDAVQMEFFSAPRRVYQLVGSDELRSWGSRS